VPQLPAGFADDRTEVMGTRILVDELPLGI
jgi:hypothetical protein